MLGSREDGEDALQQAFVRAHKALAGGRAPDRVRPWLYAIARNRCLTLIAARREAAVPADDLEPSFDGLAAEVERRADLRELVADLGRLPDDQRAALVLAELGDLGHRDIARVIGCPPAKVKALVFQARTALIAERDARRTPCDEIRAQLETARAGVLRRGALRKHLRLCDPCAAYRVAVEGQRAGLAILLPVAPSAGLKLAVLVGAGGLGGGAEAAAAAASLAAGGRPPAAPVPVSRVRRVPVSPVRRGPASPARPARRASRPRRAPSRPSRSRPSSSRRSPRAGARRCVRSRTRSRPRRPRPRRSSPRWSRRPSGPRPRRRALDAVGADRRAR